MKRGKFRILICTAFLAAAASSGAVPKKAAKRAQPPAAAKSLVQNCDAHKFETTIDLTVNGVAKQSKVRLCGTEGQSDSDWIHTLKDAVQKTAASVTMATPIKAQIVAAVNAEIARLSAPPALLSDGTDIAHLPKAAATTPEVPLARDYGALPPLPSASVVAPPHVLGPAGSTAPTPLLTLRCALAGDEDRPSRCDSIDKDTVLVVRADEAFSRGVEVRFVRKGNSKAELTLPAMRAGQTATLRLPPAVCAGVVRSRVEIQALGGSAPAGTPAGTVGEYDLRC
jgi:hypothetical protein